MIAGVKTKTLITHADERGWLYEILRNDDEMFKQFGQVYISAVYPGVVKAWHCHARQTDSFTIVSGMAKLVLADLREDSSTKGEVNEFIIGDENRMLIQIPTMVHHGIKGIGTQPALALNCPDQPFDKDNQDEIRLPHNTPEIQYDWEIRHG